MSKAREAKKMSDYGTFHRTGRKVEKQVSTSHSVAEAMTDETTDNKAEVAMRMTNADEQARMTSQLLAIGEDITDFIDENPIEDIIDSLSDLDFITKRTEELRSMYRNKFKDLMIVLGSVDGAEDYEQLMTMIKDYILAAKKARKRLRDLEQDDSQMDKNARDQAFLFILSDVKKKLGDLEAEFTIDDTRLPGESELLRRGKELSEIPRSMKDLSEKFPVMWSHVSDRTRESEVKALIGRYDLLHTSKDKYVAKIKKLSEEMELEKEEIFNVSKLNIKLQKFKGYDSSIDIFTFRSTFEKLFARSTPKRMMPDLLRNNFLDGTALSLVEGLDNIDEIWSRLKAAFGNAKIMLNRKLDEMKKLCSISSARDPEKIIDAIQKVVNIMKDLMMLSKDHKIEDDLYHGDGLEKIFKIIGEGRFTIWIAETCESNLSKRQSWESVLKFLERESKVQQQKILLLGKDDSTRERSTPKDSQLEKSKKNLPVLHTDKVNTKTDDKIDSLICSICNRRGHVATQGPNYTKIIQYFTCPKFVNMTPAERFNIIKEIGLCFQCLLPGADGRKGKHGDGKCQRDYVCKHPSHNRYKKKMHVLVCEEHKTSTENQDLLKEYKSKCILKEKAVDLPTHSKDIKLTFHADGTNAAKIPTSMVTQTEVRDNAIYQLQRINVDGKICSLFFDSGCGDFVSRYQAVNKIGSRATQECPGPIRLGGVGNVTTESTHGIYRVKLPLYDGDDAQFTGVCLDDVTGTFPEYPIKGKVEHDIKEAYIRVGGTPANLPQLPSYVGGKTDFLIGIKYLRYHPQMVFQMPSGLAIYRSIFKNADGGRGVVGGPHKVFTNIERQFHLTSDHFQTFLCNQAELYRMGYQINLDVSLLGIKDCESNTELLEIGEKSDIEAHVTHEKRFDVAENTGSEITYRCIRCRSCQSCKDCERTEAISIKEEVEEDLIARSLKLDVKNRSCTATLPMVYDPVQRLAPNKNKAMKVYDQQMRKLIKNPKDKEDVLKSEKKLQDLGFVEYVRNLPKDERDMLKESKLQNFIPWRLVWKSSSISTPCRIVFDASQPTDSGFSLNDILAKGRNNMNRLQEILIRWSIHRIGFHTDIQKMYNCVRLRKEDWCLQRYVWQENLDPAMIPEEKIIKTLIYGVKSSGNLAERSIRETAKMSKGEYPEVNEIVQKDVYVDDCLSGEKSEKMAAERANQLEIVLNKGGFTLKGMAFSGKKPPESMSDDGASITVAGVKWYTEEDLISLNIAEMTFSKKHRGRRLDHKNANSIPDRLTRRHCVAKVAEIFDMLGKFTPITASMKLDLHDLVSRKLEWDDLIPDNLRPIWESHFRMMQEMKDIRYKRVIVPDDAVDLKLETLDFGDASKALLCVSIYARFRRRNGEYSCQQVLSRSRLIPETMTQPRAELYAAMINTHSGEIVRRAFHKYHQRAFKFTDSQIVLHWVCKDNRQLKQWVRNRVLEVRRFTKVEDWSYIGSKNMIADIGTRRGCKLRDIDQNSTWINGLDWMTKPPSSFPSKSIKEITLRNEDFEEIKNEVSFPHGYSDVSSTSFETCIAVSRKVPGKVVDRYRFSQYVVDPNRHNFMMVIRITAIVLKFINILRKRVAAENNTSVQNASDSKFHLSTKDIQEAESYFFRKATGEIKHFYRKEVYQKYSTEQDGILKYTGRILPSGKIEAVVCMTDVMKDLSSCTFCVPLIDKHSPIAYSIANYYHWDDKSVKHRGIETTLRYILKYVFIIEGREIVTKIKKGCERCRYLEKQTIDVSMGPVSKHNLKIAPAFYISQVDLAGPFKSYSNSNKRATVKIWLAVFCCATTGTTCIKVMEDYSSPSFIQAFIRLSCEVGYPKLLLIDSGSQLLSSCGNMKINFQDLKFRLHHDVGVECEVCPVGGHNMHGKVERKIREIRESIEKTASNERLSIMQWETLSSEIGNRINDLPIAVGNVTSNFENMDLITPNRLRLGRNNDRSPIGNLSVTNDAAKIIEENKRIFNTWFECWLITHVPMLMFQPKWFKISEHIKVGDIVLFLKHDSVLSSTYQYGIVTAVDESQDGLIRKVHVKYRNHYEDFD